MHGLGNAAHFLIIYNYTYALDAAKIGQPTRVIVERDGQRVTLPVTPEAR